MECKYEVDQGEGHLGQQRKDNGGCVAKRQKYERVELPLAYVTDCVSCGHFCLAQWSFLPCADGYHPERDVMPLLFFSWGKL